jgi:hypothetical protein
MRWFVCLALLAVFSACGRPLTDGERAFAAGIMANDLDTDRIRLINGAPVANTTFRRAKRPRTTCREKLMPPITDDIITSKPAAVTLWNSVYFSDGWYLKDSMPAYPDTISLSAAMLLGHELVHVWQWQNRHHTGYSPWRAAAEHGRSSDPYLFDLETQVQFLDFGYEQQGAIMEEYLCCRALAPQSPRTLRLHALLRQELPLRALPISGRESTVFLPWGGAEIDGICS